MKNNLKELWYNLIIIFFDQPLLYKLYLFIFVKKMKKLSKTIERTEVIGFNCKYQYKFSTNQWLEDIDNLEYFGISNDSVKELVIETLVSEFKMALEEIIYSHSGNSEDNLTDCTVQFKQPVCEHNYQPETTCGVFITCCTKCGDII